MKRSVLVGAVAVLGASLLVLVREDVPRSAPGRANAASSARGRTLAPLETTTPAEPARPGRVDLPALPPARSAVSGFVRDVKGAPVAGATVALLADAKCSARTGTDGAFSLVPTLAAERLTLHATAPSLAPRVLSGVAPGSSRVVIVLRAGETTVRGRVVRAFDRRPVSGARLEAASGDWLGRATTDAAGDFELAQAPSGALGLVVSAEGLVPRVVTVSARRGTSEPVEVALDAGVTVRGVVVHGGAPCPDARVVLRQEGVPLPFERRETRSDAHGCFALAGVQSGEVHLHARTERAFSETVVVRPASARDPEPVRLELGAPGSIVGRVSCGGAPVPLARVTTRDEDGGPALSATTDARGEFALGPVAPGSVHELRIEAKGFARRSLEATTDEATDVALQRAAILAVRVTPPAEAIEIEATGGERRSLQGGGLVEDLPAGPAWILARTPGCAPGVRCVDLVAGETTRAVIELAAGAPLRGTCRAEDGSPMAGASVFAIDIESGPLGASSDSTTDAEGRFELAHLGASAHRVVAVAGGFLDAEACVAPGAQPLALTLARSHGLEVQVTTPPAAKRRAEILVRLEPSSGGEAQQRVLSAASGRASAVFDRLPGQSYVLTVLSPGLAPARSEVDPRSQATAVVALEAGADGSGLVVDRDGRGVPGAAIAYGRNAEEDLSSEGELGLVAMTDGRGAFHAGLAPSGEEVTITHPDFAPLVARLEPGAGRKLVLLPGSRIVGRVLTADGAARPDVGVLLEGPVSRRTKTEADGSFRFKGLPPGTYRVANGSALESGAEITLGDESEVAVVLRR